MMTNPWLNLPDDPPFVLREDEPYIEAFNSLHKASDVHWINLAHTPEPRLGPVDAPVIILQLNPSYSEAESDGPKDYNRLNRAIESIKDESHNHLGATSPDGWWKPRLGALAADVGNEQLAKAICSIEFFPYRSRRFGHGQVRLPSQAYTFSLVRNGLDRNALFIVTRNFPLWSAAIPELHSRLGTSVFCLKNSRSSYFTKNNLPHGAYEQIVQALRAGD